EERVRKGKFREDLYYRLSTVPIRVPSLQERRDDIPVLFRKFAHDFAEKYRMQVVRLDDRAEQALENYRWPGNIRELKNVAEQISVLSEDRTVSLDVIQRTMPQLLSRNLPVPTGRSANGGGGDFQERELLYKVLFDMKNDLNDLKAMFYELVKSNNLRMPDPGTLRQLQSAYQERTYDSSDRGTDTDYEENRPDYYPMEENRRITPIIIDGGKNGATFDKSEVEEPPLAMDEIEKEAIKRSLKKYNGRRKEAAEELKISERTLYRKIKQYDL
ncbi:MAG: helix-turn-helix domain-containing protein, partial [Saprospiraceae bacterium]